MKYIVRSVFFFLLTLIVSSAAIAAPAKPYDHIRDIAYGEAKGETLYLDIFVPNGEARFDYFQPNDNGKGLGLIDVISGGWNSSIARQDEHEKAALFSILCARGYTIFAIRPGSLPDYTALEMIANLKRGVRWVKAHAEEYKVDPKRMGMLGASAGGHLSTLAMTLAEPGDPDSNDPLMRWGTEMQAVGVFFPPTDFIDWDGKGTLADVMSRPALIASGGEEAVKAMSDEALHTALKAISPVYTLSGKTPPLLLIHGDADPIVPLAQSYKLKEAMEKEGNSVELIVKPGGGHFWLTLPEEVIKLADWFDKQLADAK